MLVGLLLRLSLAMLVETHKRWEGGFPTMEEVRAVMKSALFRWFPASLCPQHANLGRWIGCGDRRTSLFWSSFLQNLGTYYPILSVVSVQKTKVLSRFGRTIPNMYLVDRRKDFIDDFTESETLLGMTGMNTTDLSGVDFVPVHTSVARDP
jgi:hypothetical protein